tara:strand:+ start:1064 stop:1390 length:327 start_codon:yes stop_codon:yes gene_type:complete
MRGIKSIAKLLSKAGVRSYFLLTIEEDPADMVAVQATIQDASTSTQVCHVLLQNMIGMLEKYNGLDPAAAVGALHAMVDVAGKYRNLSPPEDVLDDLFLFFPGEIPEA